MNYSDTQVKHGGAIGVTIGLAALGCGFRLLKVG